jgi:anti-anti-sigma factor
VSKATGLLQTAVRNCRRVNLEALEYFSSAGLGVLAHTVKRATAAGTEVHVTVATGIVKEVLDITRLSTLMGKS